MNKVKKITLVFICAVLIMSFCSCKCNDGDDKQTKKISVKDYVDKMRGLVV